MKRITTIVEKVTYKVVKNRRHAIKDYPCTGDLEWHDHEGCYVSTESFDSEEEAKKTRDRWIEEFTAKEGVQHALATRLLRRADSKDGLTVHFYGYPSAETVSSWPDEVWEFYLLPLEKELSRKVT
ncbi:MAG TPA: hypothetical protein VMQ44_00485 [Candidatus Saccharimonadales bacterium]|nr:hypothetical protein [Candidatus Saccharimonadales bacterium]